MIRAVFAVVGHPNKGKSSIVSTLAHNDEVKISQRSGTTERADKIRVETNHSGFELIDTPGFQRAGSVLEWLNKSSPRANERANAIRLLLQDKECQKRFPDEVALLTPLINGAAILYVVDGSRPYGAEYESEMEILRWTGQPSMALINPIEGDEYVEDWNNALAQYFKTVRVFNPMKADFEKQLELLSAFAHLKPEWQKTLQQVTIDLKQKRQIQKENAVTILVRLLEDLCFYQASQKVINRSQTKTVEPALALSYQQWMEQREKKAIDSLLLNYSHQNIDLSIDSLTLPPDLFDTEQWFMWGLNKKQLAAVSTISGAAAGAAVDIAVAGHSFMLGAIGGGIVGFGSAWLGSDRLVNTSIKGIPLGGYEACYGPVKNKNFPYVVIGRFIYLYSIISERNHALREQLNVDNLDLNGQIKKLEKSDQKLLHTACAQLVKQKMIESLDLVLLPLFDESNHS